MPRLAIAAALAAALIVAYAVFKMTRGIRNKNPGNLKASGNDWEGQIGTDPDGFAIFDSAHTGLRAAGITALAYRFNHNVFTLRNFGLRWDADENRGTYGADLAARLGVDPDEIFDFDGELPALLRAVVIQENGFSPYSYADYAAAAQSARVEKGIV